MKYYFIIISLYSMFMFGCHQHTHDQDGEHTHENQEAEDIKFQYTAYTNDFEVFAEADAFIPGQTANVLAHFSALPNFRAVETGKMTIVLNINGQETRQTLDAPSRKGIYSFDIVPVVAGKGSLRFELENASGTFVIPVPNVEVFAQHDDAALAASKIVISHTNTTVFTKEQSWKIDFATAYPENKPFGQVIKTTGLVQSAQGSEIIITAKINGIVMFSEGNILEGKEVKAGQVLFSISGSEMAEDNLAVKYAEAKNNFDKAKADYERMKELAAEKIVSEKDLLAAENIYNNARNTYENYARNFNANGQKVSTSVSGFVKQVFVKNGTYVEAGQAIITVSQNKTLMLSAEVSQKYAPILGTIHTAHIHALNDAKTYTLEELNGKVLSYGKAANADNYLIPINLQIDNKGSFVAGSFVEIFLKTITNNHALTVPLSAILEEQGHFFVWVQITPELFEKRLVSTGNTDGISIEVLSGIGATDRIVTRGAMLVKLAQATGTLDAHSGHVH